MGPSSDLLFDTLNLKEINNFDIVIFVVTNDDAFSSIFSSGIAA